MDNLKIPQEDIKSIEDAIGSDESVVGIDAKRTHVIIIYMLQQIQSSISNLESRLESLEAKLNS